MTAQPFKPSPLPWLIVYSNIYQIPKIACHNNLLRPRLCLFLIGIIPSQIKSMLIRVFRFSNKLYWVVSLTHEWLISGKTATVSGWGLLNETGTQGSTTLQFVSLPTLTDDSCVKAYGQMVSFDPSQQFCAGNSLGQDACSGDSGSGCSTGILICKLNLLFLMVL